MAHDDRSDSLSPHAHASTRLAENDALAVDACGCGRIELHVGAMTLRLTPQGLSALMTTLGEATAAFAARYGGRVIADVGGNVSFSASGLPRGKA